MSKEWYLANTLADVADERARQDERWGDQSHHPDTTWLAILVEEVGEAAQCALHDQFRGHHAGKLRGELVQVAAVAVAWIEAVDSRDERGQA